MTDETMQAAATAALEYFETLKREDGSVFTTLADGRPDWLHEAVYAAHNGEAPNDWRYDAAYGALERIADGAGEDDGGEFADWFTDVYNADLLRWLTDNIGRADACDDAADELGDETAGIIKRIQYGQYVEAEFVFSTMYRALADQDGDE